MNILFFGPNGSGKGTQGTILKKKYNWETILLALEKRYREIIIRNLN